jgi:GTP pyrophosphokinase
MLRKAFGMMLNVSARQEEQGYVPMALETAKIILDEMGLGLEPVLCCILKNVADSMTLSPEAIELEYSQSVRYLLDGIRKLENVNTSLHRSNQENFIGLFLTLSDDIRALLVRFAMRLYDMRHLNDYPFEKQGVIVGETISLYIPTAHRLGLYRIKNELEDRAMRFNTPYIYRQIEQKIRETRENRDQYTAGFISPIAGSLAENKIDCEIRSRVKSIPSIYRKMQVQKVDFEKVYDLFAIRIILNSIMENEAADCWKIYSLVTDIYSPNPHRLRDWVSFPKQNGYESLHTTVIGPEGKWVEVQIRTRRMDEIAEKGYAAHWRYKSEEKPLTTETPFIELRGLLEHPASVSMLNSMALDKKVLSTADIFIFTEDGNLKKLRRGLTVQDFARETLKENNSICTGAIVNKKMVPLRYTLVNGDTVKLLLSKAPKPRKGWLETVTVPFTLTRVKQALNLGVVKEAGPEKTISGTSHDSSFPESISKIKAGKEGFVVIDSTIKSLHYQLARCCNPTPGNSIYAFVSVTQGIKIHRTSCANTHQLLSHYPYRILEARWKDGKTTKQEK